jgi:ABC-type antimicrobial peptide transport system permease subunit
MVALLVLILERTQMIGILKALGLTIGVSVRSSLQCLVPYFRGLLWGMESE